MFLIKYFRNFFWKLLFFFFFFHFIFRLALRGTEVPPHLPGISPSEWIMPDPTSFPPPLPVSQRENTSWPSASSPSSTSPTASSSSSTSPTASSPTNPWAVSHSPPDAWESFSKSPNMAFLHSCQSPPSSTLVDSNTSLSPQVTSSKCSQEKTAYNPFVTQSNRELPLASSNLAPSNPFSKVNMVNSTLPVNGCGTWQPAWSGNLFDSNNKLICSWAPAYKEVC